METQSGDKKEPQLASKPIKPSAAAGPLDSPKGEEILGAAADIFHRKGFHATSIQEIADQVGMLKGSLYYYISTKDDLLIEIMNKVHTESEAYLAEVFASKAEPSERLRNFIHRHIEFFNANRNWVSVYLHEYKAVPPALRIRFAEMRDRYEAKVVEIVDEGQRKGQFHSDIDSRVATRAILGMCNWLYAWHRPQGGLTAERISADFARLLLHGIERR